MAIVRRSTILAVIAELTEGELQDISSGSDFLKLREGFGLTNELQTVDSDEMINSIGKSKSIVVGEAPTGTWPFYLKGSGVEGQAPEYAVILKSCLGGETDNAVEYDTVAGSTVSVLNVDTGEGASYAVGQAVLVKNTAGWEIRNISSITGDALSLNFDLNNAPASGINLGKAVFFYPTSSGHPTYSAHSFQAESASAYKEAIAGCRTTSLSLEFPAKDLAQGSADFEGIAYYYDHIEIGSTNKYLDFDDGGGEENAVISEKIYRTPHELAREIQEKLDELSTDTITCVYSDTSGKYIIASDGATFELLFLTGTNTANTIAPAIGFDVADETAALSYSSDSAISFDSPYAPSFDISDQIVIKGAQFLIGDADSIQCRGATTASITIATPKQDVNSICAENGVSESITVEREVTLTANLILSKYDAEMFDKALNNTTTQVVLNAGPKSGTNWTAGKAFNFYMANASITATPIQEENSYVVIAMEARAFVTDTKQDVYLNFL